MTETGAVSRREAWLMAARPHTLPAAAAPVIVGVGLAVHEGLFASLPALAAVIGASLIQIGTNFANDYYDALSGIDTDEREGFTRVTQSGLIEPTTVKRATFATFALAILLGTYLVYVGGLPILVLGLASVISGFAYAGGPYPLASHGLGDIFVFCFFGVFAVVGTFYVQAASLLAAPLSMGIPPGTVTTTAIVASLPVASLSTAILVVNNVRDIDTDRAAGKRTLAVIMGLRASRAEYVALCGLAYAVPIWFWFAGGFGAPVLLPLVTVPLMVPVVRTVLTDRTGPALNDALASTAKILAIFSLLFAIGIGV